MTYLRKIPRFYPIFDHLDWLERMLPLGVEFVQLRIKDKDIKHIREQVERTTILATYYNTQVVINDYWEAAIDFNARWVHLGQEDLDTADIRAIRRAGIKIGLSTHDDDELERALSMAPDYVALGPVYPTILKSMKWKQQGVEKLTTWKKRVNNTPLVAIGGMSVERAQGAFDAGADCVSAVTDITLHSAPEERVKQWLEVCA